MTNEDEILKKRCRIEEVDFKLASRLKTKVFPLLEEAHRRLGYRFDKAFLEQEKGTKIRLDNSRRLMQILCRLNPGAFSREDSKAISLHLEFLTVCEGYFTSQINFLVFVLIANGHDLYSSRKGKHVKTLDAIEEVDLAFKLKFLGEHGFDELTDNEGNFRKLRNSIAHLFYEIDSKGNVKVGKKSISEDDYTKLFGHLRNVAMSLHVTNWLYYSRFAIHQEELEKIKNMEFEEIKCSCGYLNLVPKNRQALGLPPIECTNCGKLL